MVVKCYVGSRQLKPGIRSEQGVFKPWKMGLISKEDYFPLVKECRNKVNKAKVLAEIDLTKNVKAKSKSFFGPVRDGDGDGDVRPLTLLKMQA